MASTKLVKFCHSNDPEQNKKAEAQRYCVLYNVTIKAVQQILWRRPRAIATGYFHKSHIVDNAKLREDPTCYYSIAGSCP